MGGAVAAGTTVGGAGGAGGEVDGADSHAAEGEGEAARPSAAPANSKEKTPMCLVNELARYNKVTYTTNSTVLTILCTSHYVFYTLHTITTNPHSLFYQNLMFTSKKPQLIL